MTSAPRILVDFRCLQDQDYKFRGVGFYVSAMLRGRAHSCARNWELIALVDPALEELPAEYAALADRVSACWNWTFAGDGAAFISPSPMTHDPALSVRFLCHPKLVKAAIVYDFIPLDWPGYLPQVSDEISYFAKLANLKHYDLYLPISNYSAKRLRELLQVPSTNIFVIGAPIRRTLLEAAALCSGSCEEETPEPYFLSVGGGDRRKNTEVAVRAVRKLRRITGRPIKLVVVGHYGEEYRRDLTALAASDGAFPEWLEFQQGINDSALARLYSRAVATIAPSHIEGFSLPVIEAWACRSPVVASTCAAHLELVYNNEALFASHDADELTNKLRAVFENSSLRTRLRDEQATSAAMYYESAVTNRFWTSVSECIADRLSTATSPALALGTKPRIAMLTPYPPEQSGVARFSERTLQAARHQMKVDLYTQTARPLILPEGVTDAGPVQPALFRRDTYDAIISVIGNSHFHNPMFEIMETYGGPCILHDSRLTHYYYSRYGDARFREWAGRLLGRSVTSEEVTAWLNDQNPPSLFIEPILERAEPLIVHTRRYAELLGARYGVEAKVTVFPPNITFSDEDLSSPSRSAARSRIGVPESTFAITTYGWVAGSKGFAPLIIALDMLRFWKVPAELYFVGSNEYAEEKLNWLAREFRVKEYVHSHKGYVDDRTYRDYLLGADAAVQLRTYDFGQPSAALTDCISAGLPTVANESLAESCDAPAYVHRIHNHISPLIVAERLACIYEARSRGTAQLMEWRHHYCDTHNFDRYTELLMRSLGLA